MIMKGEEGKPVFHDFLGMKTCNQGNYKPIQQAPSRSSGLEEEIYMSTRPLAFSVPTCSSVPERLSCGKWEGLEAHCRMNRSLGRKRDPSTSSLVDCLQDDNLESSSGIKMSRFDAKDYKRGRQFDDDVHFGMQPPRPTPACQTLVQSSMGIKLDLMVLKKWECPVSLNTGPAVYNPSQLTRLGVCHERASANVLRENTLIMPTLLSRPPADEGSGTELKGFSIANLVNNNSPSATIARNTSGQSLSAGRSKFLFDNGVPESSIPSTYQSAASAIHQLTIFYGGQAHVFDDVHHSKVDAIMALAGSNGHSWSTTYFPKPRSSAVTEGDIPSTQREKGGSRMTAINVSGEMAVYPEFQTLLPAIARAGHGGSNVDTNFVQLASESMQGSIGGNGRKDGSLVSCPSTCSNEGDKETLCHSQQLV